MSSWLGLPARARSKSHFERQYYFVVWASFLGPFLLASTFGLASGLGLSFFIAMAMIAAFLPIIGVPDLVFAIADWLDKRRKIEVEARRRRHIVAEFGGAFRKQLAGMGHAELFIMGAAIARKRLAFTREASDAATKSLIKSGFARRATEFRADGFPFVFVDLTWTLMQELAHEVLFERDRRAPGGNQLGPEHVPEELYTLFPERFAEQFTVAQIIQQIATALAIRIGTIMVFVGVIIPTVWGVILIALTISVGGLLAAGWGIVFLLRALF